MMRSSYTQSALGSPRYLVALECGSNSPSHIFVVTRRLLSRFSCSALLANWREYGAESWRRGGFSVACGLTYKRVRYTRTIQGSVPT